MNFKLLCLAMALPLLLVGCASAPKGLYAWGAFPQQTYLMYSAPEKAQPSQQILILEEDIVKAKAKSSAVPPGLYSHLGLLYLMENNTDRALQNFNLEKQVYPESTVLMNRFISKIQGTGAGQ